MTATVGIGPNATGGFELRVDLEAELPGVERTIAEEFVAKGPSGLPVQQRDRNNIEVTLTVV